MRPDHRSPAFSSSGIPTCPGTRDRNSSQFHPSLCPPFGSPAAWGPLRLACPQIRHPRARNPTPAATAARPVAGCARREPPDQQRNTDQTYYRGRQRRATRPRTARPQTTRFRSRQPRSTSAARSSRQTRCTGYVAAPEQLPRPRHRIHVDRRGPAEPAAVVDHLDREQPVAAPNHSGSDVQASLRANRGPVPAPPAVRPAGRSQPAKPPTGPATLKSRPSSVPSRKFDAEVLAVQAPRKRNRSGPRCRPNCVTSLRDGTLVSSPSNAWHKWALLPTDEISNTEPVAPVVGNRMAYSVRSTERESCASYFRDGTLVVRHVIIFGHGHGLQRAIIDESQHRTPERLIMAQH